MATSPARDVAFPHTLYLSLTHPPCLFEGSIVSCGNFRPHGSGSCGSAGRPLWVISFVDTRWLNAGRDIRAQG